MKLQEQQTNRKTILFSIVLLLVIYFFRIPCPIKKIFNLDCPGCGITRSILALTKLNFYQSFRYNPLLFLFYPFLFPYVLYIAYIKIFNKDDNITCKIPKIILIFITVLFLIYGVLRNIPVFYFLKPTKI